MKMEQKDKRLEKQEHALKENTPCLFVMVVMIAFNGGRTGPGKGASGRDRLQAISLARRNFRGSDEKWRDRNGMRVTR